jgi:hypothetical protein
VSTSACLQEVEIVVKAVVVRAHVTVEVRLLADHLHDGVADQAGPGLVAHVEHREPEVGRGEDAILVAHVERLLQDAGVRLRVVPVRVDVLEGLADEVVPTQTDAGGNPPLVEVGVKVVELPVEALLRRSVVA